MTDSTIRVAVVFGGRSGEHAVSCATAAGILSAIDRDRFDVVPIGISPTGRWVLADDDPARWRIETGRVPSVGTERGEITVPMGEVPGPLTLHQPGELRSQLNSVDVVFPVLHGPFGEDGTVQGFLELAGLPYVGSGVLASAAGMDKHYMKALLRDAGFTIGPYLTITAQRWRTDRDAVLAEAGQWGWPVFVKPARAGSSVGVSRVAGPDELSGAIAEAQRHDPKVLVEAAISGREIECAVLQGRRDDPPRTTLPGEISVSDTGRDFYDYESKYFDTAGVDLSFPAELPPEVTEQVRDLSARAFEVLGCEGLARVDFFYTDDGQVIINELNTMPGFTPHSMFPMLWQRSGMSYRELITDLIELALQRPAGLR